MSCASYEPEADRVILLDSFPPSSVGAPLPHVLADDYGVVLAYRGERPDPDWDGTSVRAVSPETDGELIVLVRFSGVVAHYLGQPNDEAFAGHPLASRGLRRYRVHRVEASSWIRSLERMNSVHPYHSVRQYADLQHLIFAFHDSTFECVCLGFQHQVTVGSMASVLTRMAELLRS